MSISYKPRQRMKNNATYSPDNTVIHLQKRSFDPVLTNLSAKFPDILIILNVLIAQNECALDLPLHVNKNGCRVRKESALKVSVNKKVYSLCFNY